MALVIGRKAQWRIVLAHGFVWALIALTVFPLLAIVSISLRPGNFATGSLIPDSSAGIKTPDSLRAPVSTGTSS